MKGLHKHIILIFSLWSFLCHGQDLAYNDVAELSFEKAQNLAFKGENKSAKDLLIELVKKNPNDLKSRALLARTYSWGGFYDSARKEFNRITSIEKSDRNVWVSAIKNELYANNSATAYGLANKALGYIASDTEIKRLQALALKLIQEQKYKEKAWYNTKSKLKGKIEDKPKKVVSVAKRKEEKADKLEPEGKKELKNRISLRNSFTVFDQRYDPMVFSSIEFRRQTLAGSILPRINYANRNGKHGVQYDIDFYPKFSKRFYAYMNYGFSNASIYPRHKIGGDLYVNLPWAIEFSAGGRHIALEDRNVTVITNSLGHYRGNYYFSLRSSITPKSDNLTRVSGNFLIRKYLKDADNFLGFNIGMGYSPELRQLISGDELLAETLLYIESQRASFQYQFTGKKNPNIYSASIGVSRQELSFDSGNYVWGISAGLAYQVRF